VIDYYLPQTFRRRSQYIVRDRGFRRQVEEVMDAADHFEAANIA